MPGETARLSCRALLFDLDGVLVDSATCIARAWQRWAERHGCDAQAVIRTSHGRRALETIQQWAPDADAARELALLVAEEAGATSGLCEMAGVRALLGQLPMTCWAIVTSAVRSVAEHRLRFVGLPLPTVLVSGDDVAVGKPDPAGYLEAARRLGLWAGDCVVVEDAPVGIEAARRAGMRVLAVTTSHTRDRLRGATLVVPDLAAVAVHALETASGATLEVTVPQISPTLAERPSTDDL